jgi:membrane protein
MKLFRKKGFLGNLKEFGETLARHNLLVLASSISYYAVLGLAPMLLILLGVASLIGSDMQQQVIDQAKELAPQVSTALEMVFQNLNERVNLGSISGIIGVSTLLFTASIIFMQLRFSLDVIYGDYNPHNTKTIWQTIKERVFLMIIVLIMSVIFVAALFIRPIFYYIFGEEVAGSSWGQTVQMVLNFLVFFVLFVGFYYLIPSRKQKLVRCAKVAVLSSVFFILGKVLISFYFANVATESVYGAAGALFVFMIWAYYSSITLFFSVELFEFLRKKGVVS